MTKKDINITADINSVGSRSKRIVEREKAIEVLERAKLIPRKVVFLKQGESEFSRKLNNVDDTSEMLNSREAAVYLHISYSAFARRQEKANLPSIKRNGNKKYFRLSDLDKFQSKFTKA